MNEQIRKEFTVWMLSELRRVGYNEKMCQDFVRTDDGSYSSTYVQACWNGWQASRATLVVVLPSSDGIDERTLVGSVYKFTIDTIRELLQQKGVTVK